jgi:putative ABC transport system permease protein
MGIALNVSMYAGVRTIIWQPLPYPDPDRLIQVWQTNLKKDWNQASVSIATFADWRSQSRSARLAAFVAAGYNLADGDQPERVSAVRASGDLLSILGAGFALGKGFGQEEEKPGLGNVAVLSHRFWTRRFDADSAIVGRSIVLDGQPYTVVGVLASGFRFEDQGPVDLYVPLTVRPAEGRGNWFLQVIGRLTPGATFEAAGAELKQIAARLATAHPEFLAETSVRVIPLYEEVMEAPARQAGVITMISVAFVLLIACANVANLLLARATGRDRELAVRSALGADRKRLARELLAESMVLALMGGTLGLGLSFVGLGWLRSLIPPDLPRADLLGFDWRSFVFGAAITLGSGLAPGIAPAWRSSRPNLVTALRDGGRGMTGLRHGRVLTGLVGFEIALALVLLICAGLLIKGSLRLTNTDPGFVATNALAFRTSLAEKEYPDSAAVVRFEEELRARLAALDGVVAVGGVSALPFDGGNGNTYLVEGEPEPERGREQVTQTRGITPRYLTAIGIRLVKGRDFEPADRFDTSPVILINETMARRHWSNREPLGARLRLAGRWWEVVGVVQDTREFGTDSPPPPVVYTAATQAVQRRLSFVLRTEGDPAGYTERVRQAVRELAPGQPIFDVETLDAHLRDSTRNARILPELLGVFGLMALIMAVIGVYGVMAYSVAQRTQEMGVRRALGAPTSSITRLVLGQAGLVCGIGGAVGLALAAISTRGLSFFLFGVDAFDPPIFIGVTATLLIAAFGASAIPARRAMKVDPVVALRSD